MVTDQLMSWNPVQLHIHHRWCCIDQSAKLFFHTFMWIINISIFHWCQLNRMYQLCSNMPLLGSAKASLVVRHLSLSSYSNLPVLGSAKVSLLVRHLLLSGN